MSERKSVDGGNPLSQKLCEITFSNEALIAFREFNVLINKLIRRILFQVGKTLGFFSV